MKARTQVAQQKLSDDQAKAFGQALYEARKTKVPIEAFTTDDPELGMLDGYAIQQHLASLLVADGEEVVGYKLGLTSLPMQQLLGVDQPDFGPVFASGVYRDGAQVNLADFIAPRVEGEIGVILGADLSGPDCTAEQARAATEGIVAAIEIVDSRIKDWKIKICDTVADLASNGAIALSSNVVPLDGLDPRLIGLVFTKNGQLVATGAGAAALGDPMAAVAWLANTLAPMGVTLKQGMVIMTGALHAMTPVAAGETWKAEFDRIGSITLNIV